MAKHTTPRAVSQGKCNFCQGEFAKNKITQHLKSCKARLAGVTKEEGDKQRLFHLQVEGKYRPDYWMHLEIPATATLAILDDFLRYMWLECCDHLSEFEIGGESYSYEPGEDWSMGLGGLSLVGGPGVTGEEVKDEEDEDEEGEELDMQEIASEMSQQLSLEFQADLKNVPVEQIEQKLEQMFAENLPPGMPAGTLPMLRPLLSHMASSLQQGTLAQDFEAMEEEEEEEEGGMQSELGDVLEVGEKFSYVYDFGSSSTLSLRVIDEREGVVPLIEEDEDEDEDEELEDDEDEDEELEDDEDDVAIFIMARNEPPALVCHICGKPATRVPSASEYDSLAETALCDAHAKKTDYPDDLLPIVNSPRTGICGYEGEEEYDDWDEDEDEDE
jgi:hypothetical protein